MTCLLYTSESLPVLKPIEAESQDEKFLSNIIRLIEDHLSESELHVNALCALSDVYKRQRLPIVSTIFIPLTFLVGVWGMNYKWIQWSDVS